MSEASLTFDVHRLVRENIRRLTPYSSARSEFSGTAEVFLDANENAFGSPAGNEYNRYPDPLQKELKGRITELNRVPPSQTYVGNGSDEAIDLLFRIFCEPGRDSALICPPTYGMYKVSADINDVEVNEVRLTDDFHLDLPAIRKAITDRTKLIFICSPNNPTGNLMRREAVTEIARYFDGIVVVDEAYIHFADEPSLISDLNGSPNMVVLQTFSKAWGMAGLRVGLAFAGEDIIGLMNRVKPPYNVSGIAQRAVLDALDQEDKVASWIREVLSERDKIRRKLTAFDFIETIYPTQANFVLVKTSDADEIYKHLVERQIIVRNRSNVDLCGGCLRITVGTPDENERLMRALNDLNKVRANK